MRASIRKHTRTEGQTDRPPYKQIKDLSIVSRYPHTNKQTLHHPRFVCVCVCVMYKTRAASSWRYLRVHLCLHACTPSKRIDLHFTCTQTVLAFIMRC